MKEMTMRVTDSKTGEVLREEPCDLLMALCVKQGKTRMVSDKEEEESADTALCFMGHMDAMLTISLLDAIAVGVKKAVRLASGRVSPIEWGTRQKYLEGVRDKLQDSVKQVEILCALGAILKKEEAHGAKIS